MARTLRRRLRGTLLRMLLPPLTLAFGMLSWSRVQRTGHTLGRIFWRLSRRDRGRALEHLALALPEVDDAGREEIARQAIRNQATSLAELFHLLGRGRQAAVSHLSVTGSENLEALRAAGRPILLLTGHCGHWEIIAVALGERGVRVFAVGRPPEEPLFRDLLLRYRRLLGTETIERDRPGAARGLRRALRGQGVLAMLIDQDIEAEGVWVPFFGRLAHTPVGAARLALRHDLAVLPAFAERLGDGTHRITFRPPLDLPEDPEEATAVMTAAIEGQVRRIPGQWVWWHKRWRRRPPGGSEARTAAAETRRER